MYRDNNEENCRAQGTHQLKEQFLGCQTSFLQYLIINKGYPGQLAISPKDFFFQVYNLTVFQQQYVDLQKYFLLRVENKLRESGLQLCLG